jgi:hypothetical protein
MAETLSAKTSQALGITDPIKDLTTKRDTSVQEELGAGAAVQALETRKAESEAKRTSEQAQEKVRGTEELTQRQAEREAPIREQKSVIDKALMDEHFAPSKENLQDQAALFSLINVIGFAIGTGGKQNAVQAMYAMNGMLEGHQKGRSDLFKQEQVKFEKNFKALQQKATFLETELRHSLEEFTRDKRAADERASAAFASAGADFMKIYAEKNGLVAAYERAKEVRKSLDKAIEGERLRKERIEDKTDAEVRAQTMRKDEQRQRVLDREQEMRLAAQLRAEGKSERITQQTMMAQRAVNSLGGVASAVESIKELPAGTTTGMLPNLQTKDGMMNYVRNTVGRKIASREAEMLNTLFTGVGRNLASIEASGAATGLSELSKQMQSGTYINSGTDDPYKVALKLADIRRIAVENIRPAIDSGLMPKGQAETALKLVERIEAAIPFTTIDVVRAANSGKQTIGQATETVVRGGKSYKSEAEAEAAFKAGTLKAGEKVNIGGVSGTWE